MGKFGSLYAKSISARCFRNDYTRKMSLDCIYILCVCVCVGMSVFVCVLFEVKCMTVMFTVLYSMPISIKKTIAKVINVKYVPSWCSLYKTNGFKLLYNVCYIITMLKTQKSFLLREQTCRRYVAETHAYRFVLRGTAFVGGGLKPFYEWER